MPNCELISKLRGDPSRRARSISSRGDDPSRPRSVRSLRPATTNACQLASIPLCEATRCTSASSCNRRDRRPRAAVIGAGFDHGGEASQRSMVAYVDRRVHDRSYEVANQSQPRLLLERHDAPFVVSDNTECRDGRHERARLDLQSKHGPRIEIERDALVAYLERSDAHDVVEPTPRSRPAIIDLADPLCPDKPKRIRLGIDENRERRSGTCLYLSTRERHARIYPSAEGSSRPTWRGVSHSVPGTCLQFRVRRIRRVPRRTLASGWFPARVDCSRRTGSRSGWW